MAQRKKYFRIKTILLVALFNGSLSGLCQHYSQSDRLYFEISSTPLLIIYVDDNNTSGPWLGTQTHPFQNIPEGLAVAGVGQTVVVAPGTYPISSSQVVQKGRTLFLDTNVVVKFQSGAGLDVLGKLMAQGTVNNSVVFTSTAPATKWKGIRFINDTVNSQLRMCRIEKCTGWSGGKGGAVYVSNSSPEFYGCMISGNMATYGGGVFCENNASPVFTSCIFYGNAATNSGGALYSLNSTPMVTESYLFSNSAQTSAGGIAIVKGALGDNAETAGVDTTYLSDARYTSFLASISLQDLLARGKPGGRLQMEADSGMSDNYSTMTEPQYRKMAVISQNTFYQNTAVSEGGGIRVSHARIKLRDNEFTSNQALNGGGVYLNDSDSTMADWNRFEGNQAGFAGGALYLNGSSADTIRQNLFSGNTAVQTGGIYLKNSISLLTKNTFWKNTGSGTGTALGSFGGSNQVSNSIFWNNLPIANASISGTGLNVTYNDIQGGFTGYANINSYPMFVDTVSSNFHLQEGSPCINSGDPASEPDPDATRADMGMYYSHSPAYNGMKGIYTIDGNPAALRDFSNLTAAVNAMKTYHVAGKVTFLIAPGTYNEQIRIPEITGVNTVNTVTFQSMYGDSAGVVLTYAPVSAASNYTIKLDSTDNFIFHQLTIKSTGTTYGHAVEITNGATRNTFSHCRFIGNLTALTSYDLSLVHSGGAGDNHNRFEQNLFSGGSVGLNLIGISATSLESGTTILDNQFYDQSFRGLRLYYQDSPLIQGNTVSVTAANTAYIGIVVSHCNNELKVLKNKLAIGSGSYGIVNAACYASPGNEGMTANNFIQIAGNPIAALYCDSSTYQSVYHNSVNVTGNAVSSKALALELTNVIDVKNNILSNVAGGFAIHLTNTTTTNSDYNNLYTTGTLIGYLNSPVTSFSDLAAWQSTMVKDLHSLTTDPGYVSMTDLHINSNALLNRSGTPLASVTEDIDGQLRNPVTPDIGADEFTLTGLDASITWLAPATVPFAGIQPVKVVVKNTGATTINTLTLSYFNGTSVISQTFTNRNKPSESSDTLTFSVQQNFSNIVRMYAFIQLVNGVQDNNRTNDTTKTQILSVPLNGTYTINPVLSTAGTNFKSFGDAVLALKTNGISGGVTFQVSSATYNEQIVIPQVTGASSTKTITFQSISGDSSSVILTYNALRESYPFTLKLDGADYCIIKKMSIRATGANFARAIEVSGGATDNKFLNNLLEGVQTTSTSVNYAVFYAPEGTIADHNNLIQQNLVRYGSIGIYFAGISNSSLESGTLISKNQLINQYAHGMLVFNQNAVQLNENTINEPSSSSNMFGLYCSNCNNGSRIQKNRIIMGNGRVGIFLVGCNTTSGNEGISANNFVQVGSAAPRGFVLSSCSNQKLFHNSVNLTGTTTDSRVVSLESTSVITLNDNILCNHAGGYVLVLLSTSTTNSDYNDLFTTGSNLCYSSGGGNYGNLSTWQYYSGKDGHSYSIEPNFVNSADLHIKTNSSLNSTGVYQSIVPSDIDGQTRGNPPDIGADEFNQCTSLPAVTCPGNMTMCITTAPFTLIGGSPTGGTFSGAGVANNVFNPSAAGIGTHTLTYAYTNPSTGCTGYCSFTYTVKSRMIPVITGQASVCSLNTNVTYTTDAGNTSYSWTIPSSATLVSGQGTNTLTVYWKSYGNYNLAVSYSNTSYGCSPSATTTFPVSVLQIPGAAGSISGSQQVCEGAGSVTYSVAGITGASSYEWLVPTGSSIINGSGTSAISVSFPNYPSGGNISVSGKNSCGNGTSSSLAVSINQAPTGIVNLINSNVLNGQNLCYLAGKISTGGAGGPYTINNGAIVKMVASQTINLFSGSKVNLGGAFSAKINTNCIPCSLMKIVAAEAEDSLIHETGFVAQNSMNETFFKVYPNPFNSTFTLELTGTPSDKYTDIRILNLVGKEVYRDRFSGHHRKEISVADQPVGLYLILVNCGEKAGNMKIVKVRP